MLEDAGSAVRDELQSESSRVEAEELRNRVAIGSVLLWFPLSAGYSRWGGGGGGGLKHLLFKTHTVPLHTTL